MFDLQLTNKMIFFLFFFFSVNVIAVTFVKFYTMNTKLIVECSPGFTGDNCLLTCGPGYFGRQCNERCHCSPEKYCDPITGCMCNTTSVNCTDSGILIQVLTVQIEAFDVINIFKVSEL